MRRVPIRRHAHPDPVTPELRAEVFERDDYRCMATVLDPIGHPPTSCTDKYGRPALVTARPPRFNHMALTADHVPFPVHRVQRSRDDPARGTRRAPSRIEQLLTLCHHANVDGWASANRAVERAYLSGLYPGYWL